jgi:FMN-dependent NADH-azoreductase
VEREFTLVGVNPALDEFAELAGQWPAESLAAAAEAGRILAKAA